ncbi:ABC transporter ATP-binding protein [Oxalobacteraceae bacterium OM1]|nr:ABC transporter ATP-binding protein [Oxalobacteraceae bacterium OM1]
MRAIGLTLHVAERMLVHRLDWTVRPGECWCLIGRNGAGKSTLLRTVTGLRDPDAGRVEIQARTLAHWNPLELARQRAYLPQGRSDAFGYTVFETVLAGRHPYQSGRYWESADDHRHAEEALGALDVTHLAARDVRTLSGGERQRVALAAVLVQDTPLLLLDEPAAALDLPHQVAVMKLLGRLCRQAGKSVVMVSHDLNLMHDAATHALLLMGDGGWHAGTVADGMRSDLLSACLGYPIQTVRHGARTIYLPAEDGHE